MRSTSLVVKVVGGGGEIGGWGNEGAGHKKSLLVEKGEEKKNVGREMGHLTGSQRGGALSSPLRRSDGS